MTAETRTRARQIFLEVCDLETQARAERVVELCAGDEALKELVNALLREDPGTRDAGFAPVVSGASVEGLAAALLEAPGSMIGPYRVVRMLGEGGFGTVYLAQQDAPISRRVALKVVKLGMDTRQVVARFEQERQSLASMDHPNLARVFDAGATSNGRPYFAMEYCEGESITRYCDTNKLSVGARLALFAQVCQAVQHAHQKGLIHRDLKPGNVLISQVDGAPVAKVIDFGIAKATMREDMGESVFTQHGQFVGTPEYMSPEQAAGSGDIDTRADIYALGVMLYELLTGSTPFDGKSLRAAAYDEIRRIIREVDPPRPSTKLRESGDTATRVAEARQSEPRRLRSDLGSLYFEMDKYAESEAAYNASLPVMIAVLGPEHPLVLINRRSLANTISFLGRDAEAEPMFRETIEISERTLGKAHPQTMSQPPHAIRSRAASRSAGSSSRQPIGARVRRRCGWGSVSLCWVNPWPQRSCFWRH